MYAIRSYYDLGIDPSQRYQPYVYVAIDAELRIQAIGNGPMREILAYMAGIGSACVGINGPQMVNQGLVDAEEDTHSLFPLPASKRGEVRQVELQLINEGVNIVPTPAVESDRITSYNVCYTKLLRCFGSWSGCIRPPEWPRYGPGQSRRFPAPARRSLDGVRWRPSPRRQESAPLPRRGPTWNHRPVFPPCGSGG